MQEFLITDAVVAILELNFENGGSIDAQRFSDFCSSLKEVCLPTRGAPVLFNGRAHKPIYANSDGLADGCSWTSADDLGGLGKIILAPDGQEGARIRVDVKLARAKNGGKAWLTVDFNPTSMILGGNIHPAAFTNPETGKEVASPSSDWAAMSHTFRLGFKFLEELAGRQLFDEATKLVIERGGFHLVRAQWAATKQASNVKRVLQLLTVVYAQTIARGSGIISNATHLGLEFKPHIDSNTHDLNGGVLRKWHGTKLVVSVSIYDKLARLEQMQQSVHDLDTAEAVTVKESVREDITLHSEGIINIAQKAQKKLEEWGSEGLEFFDFISPDVFLRDHPESTAWWLQRAVFILSHHRNQGKLKRFSFGTWLVRYIETHVLHFDVIAGITPDGFHRALGLRDPVAGAWRSDKFATNDGWAARFAKVAKCSPVTVYNRRALWKAELGIDIAFPLQLYADVLHMGQASTAKPGNIVKMLISLRASSATSPNCASTTAS